ncbi:hypothetical protein OB919_06960 [Halobacteria archaeon AArc-curdl1]|uniref:Uncharacterized protein n=1 Tax=Natronosalvus hydrolyticus TaxID=2979988 RepID=A0AAP3E5S9_9EURY|nr:hypothetical protein [Halobacteria archaeon AArc-curdl1]
MDVDDPGTFGAARNTITYTAGQNDTSVSIPTTEVNNIIFERDTTLQNFRFLGYFFGVITLLLIVLAYLLAFVDPSPGPNQTMIVLILLFFIVGGIATTLTFFRHENHDVIKIHLRTDDDRYTVCGRIGDSDFVEACSKLINSDIPTTNRNTKLESVLD